VLLWDVGAALREGFLAFHGGGGGSPLVPQQLTVGGDGLPSPLPLSPW